jgi:uncharacterized membrane protein YGL010W
MTSALSRKVNDEKVAAWTSLAFVLIVSVVAVVSVLVSVLVLMLVLGVGLLMAALLTLAIFDVAFVIIMVAVVFQRPDEGSQESLHSGGQD